MSHPFELKLYVNSGFDKQYNETTDNWTTYIDPHLPQFNHYRVKVDEIEFPNTAYNIPEYNSILWYYYDTDGTNTLKYVAINFNRKYDQPQDLIDEINSGFTTNGDNITIAYNNNTNKVTLTNSTSVKIRFVSSYVWEPENANFYWQINRRLGITQDLRNEIIDPSNSLTGENSLTLLRSQCYYLECNILGSNRADQTRVPNRNFNTNILARVTANTYSDLSQLSYPGELEFDVGKSTISQIKFNVLDDRLEPVNLNGHPVTMALRFIGY
jgi:hypothetical protein